MDEHAAHDDEDLTLSPVTTISRRRPRALWGVLAAVALAAGALVVISAGDETAAPPLPIALGSAGGGRNAAPAAADASFAAWVTYLAGDGLPALGGNAPAYRLAGAADEAQVRALAEALGLDGGLVHEGPAWRVVDANGATLEVYEGAGAQWWYSSISYDTPVASSSGSGSSGGGVACPDILPIPEECATSTTVVTDPACAADGCVTTIPECPATPECFVDPPRMDCAVAEDGSVPSCPDVMPPDSGDCAKLEGDCVLEPPAPPTDLPSEDEARAIALDLLAATGIDVNGAVVTVDGPYDAWYVTVESAIDDVPSGLYASVSVGSEGVVTTAGGYLGAPERLGEYPLLDTRAAIDRFNQQSVDGVQRGGVAMNPAAGVGATNSSAVDPGVECEACPGDGTVSTVITCAAGDRDCDNGGGSIDPSVTTIPCKVQADGSETCEGVTPPDCLKAAAADAMDQVVVCEMPPCPEALPPADVPLGAPESIECPPSDPGEPLEITLTGATPILVLLPATDGTTDAYLVPGYRFTGDDDTRVDIPAVADEALAGTPSTEPTVPDVPETPLVTEPPPGPGCETLVEEDSSGTTHTVQPCGPSTEPVTLAAGEEPQIGIGYYVDVTVTPCSYVEFDGGVWWPTDADPASDGWATPTEGGTFTLQDEDHARFVGDAAGTKVASFERQDPPVDCA